MKRTNWIWCCVLVLLWSSSAISAPPMHAESGLYKSLAPASVDFQTWIDVNKFLMFVTNVGSFAYDNGAYFGKADGLYFPRGTNLSVIYAGGLWLGGKVGGDLRVSLAEYSHTYTPGPMEGGTFLPDRAEYRVYKIDRNLYNQGFYDRNPPSQEDSTRMWNDYWEWPADLGAPLNDEGNPKFVGDQTLWCVYNDASPDDHINSAGSAVGLGVEIQQTTFGFNRPGALGQCLFIDFVFINKSGMTIEDMYVSVWADPDLGDASDDLVGCDTILSLGYCYNATNDDANYGATPPAVGYDFFQGPIVETGDLTDSVYFLGQWVYGVQPLPMTSFAKYINATDPDNAQETYWYMQGLDAKNGGVPIIDPTTGLETNYQLTGNPVAVPPTGWVDDNAADRRYMQSTGPFTMEPNDTQQVVVAVVVGRAGDRLESISALKIVDSTAQATFDIQFQLPDPPNAPRVTTTPMDGGIVLHWGTDSEDEPGGYEFQGYNVYQGNSVAGPWRRIATFDIVDEVKTIWDQEFVPAEGDIVNHPVQFGNDTGIRHFMELTTDYIRGGSLHNVFDYYWAVTAYSYDSTQTPKTLENAQAAITATPQKPAGGYEYPYGFADTVAVADHVGPGDGSCVVLAVDPTDFTGHDYEVTFTETPIGDEEDVPESPMYWHLYDVDSTYYVLQNQINQSGDDAYKITDGFLCKTMGPPFDVNTIYEIANADGVLPEPDNVAYSWNSTEEFYISSDAGSDFTRMNWRGLIGTDDWEIRFTAEGSEYYDWLSEELWPDRAPFEVWNIGDGTPDDASDDVRIQIAIIDDDESGGWTPGDRIYPSEREYFEGLPEFMEYDWPDDFHIGRIVINAGVPATGTVIRFTTFKVNKPVDTYTFSTIGVIAADMNADTVYDMSSIRVVPNPYFNQSLYEPDQFDRRLKFTNLPHECEIMIFNLAGDHIVTLNKEDSDESYLTWNMLTKHELPLASGVYVYLVTASDGAEHIGKMAIFTEVEQLNTY